MSRNGLHLFVLSLGLAGISWVAWNGIADGWEPAGGGAIPTPCLFRQATGLPCPSCGTTRSIEAVAAGNLAEAARTNPFGIPIALAMGIFPLWVLHDAARSRDGFHRFWLAVERTLRERRAVSAAAIVLVAANWGWNILKGL